MFHMKMELVDIIELGKNISRALLVCETWEISHCDIRPENIMLSERGLGNWKLRDYAVGDFGNNDPDVPPICYNMARPVYWAPEHRGGPKADIYALGIVMYELLNQQSMQLIEKKSYIENLPAPKRGSDELIQIVLKACAYRPEDCSFTAPNGPLTAMAGSLPTTFFGVYISAASVMP